MLNLLDFRLSLLIWSKPWVIYSCGKSLLKPMDFSLFQHRLGIDTLLELIIKRTDCWRGYVLWFLQGCEHYLLFGGFLIKCLGLTWVVDVLCFLFKEIPITLCVCTGPSTGITTRMWASVPTIRSCLICTNAYKGNRHQIDVFWAHTLGLYRQTQEHKFTTYCTLTQYWGLHQVYEFYKRNDMKRISPITIAGIKCPLNWLN